MLYFTGRNTKSFNSQISQKLEINRHLSTVVDNQNFSFLGNFISNIFPYILNT